MDQPAWETTPAGIVIPVQAQPKSRRNAVLGVRNGRLLVAVTELHRREDLDRFADALAKL